MKKDTIVMIASVLLVAITIGAVLYNEYSDNKTESIKIEKKILKKNTVKDINFDDNKINIYMFWGEGCPHCEELSKYFSTIEKDYKKYYNLYTLEVWNNEDNNTLMKELAKKLNIEVKGVPFLIIGDQHFSGYSEEENSEIEKAIQEEIKKQEHTDIYKSFLEENKETT